MPIHPSQRALYPKNWPAISRRIRFERAGNHCEWCGAANYWPHPETGSRVVSTVANLNHRPENNDEDSQAVLRRNCHNTHDGPKRAANRRIP